MLLKYAIVVLRSGDDHFDKIALNYTQLSLDYQECNRLPTENQVDYYVMDSYTYLHGYDIVMVVNAGTIFLWGAYEHHYKKMIEASKHEYIHFSDDVWFHKPLGDGTTHIEAKFIHKLNTDSAEEFYNSHDTILTSLIDDSNITYLMHNEIPNYGDVTKPVDWAITVSSGFFINCILDHHGFSEKSVIHHVDISKISLHVHKYTIENWDGNDFESWVEHLNNKFPSMSLWNRKKFTSEDKKWKVVWKDVQNHFGDKWQEHWNKYKSLNHKWHRMNIKDISSIDTNGQGIIWWDGALKRIPSNLLKTSKQSHQNAIDFLWRLPEDTICYGNDHCNLQFDGISSKLALKKVLSHNSREKLWTDKI